jgi:eukaryotic-like serine/threonine-protein kinase
LLIVNFQFPRILSIEGISVTDAHPEIDPAAELAEEFVARYRRGERPSLTEYTQKHPELAERIRKVFPMMVLMEEAAPADDQRHQATCAEQSTDPIAPLPKPEQLGGYRILREIGRGGMGVVYEAEQVALGRHVALKVLPLHATKDSARLQRFRREARAAARLHHTHIVPVYEVGDEGDMCYYAMQYIHGQPLDQVLEEVRALREASEDGGAQAAAPAAARAAPRAVAQSLCCGLAPNHRDGADAGAGSSAPPPLAEAAPRPEPPAASSILQTTPVHYYRSVARIGLQVAGALAYAHREGVIHRDIKPSNLLLELEGRIWVADFGLAKTEADPLTGTGDLVGTLRYMPPERFRGWSDPRSDIYSLGLTLYEMLALQPAFAETDQVRLVHQLLHVAPPPLRRLDRQISRDLATIVTKAIDKEPTRRYQTADELVADLQRFIEDRPVQARPSGALERTWRWCKRNPALAALTTSFFAALILGLIGVTWQWLRAEDNAATAQDNLGKANKAGEQLRDQLWQSFFDQAQARTYSRQAGQRYKALEAVREAAQIRRTPELRDLAIACLALTDIRVGKEWEGALDKANPLAVDPSFDRYARREKQGYISVRSIADDQELFPLPYPKAGTHVGLRFSPDGKYLAAMDYQASLLTMWTLESRSVAWKQPFRSHAFGFTPDSRQMVIGRNDGSLDLIDLATGALERSLGKGPPPCRVAVSPDGKRLASSHFGGVLPNEAGILQVRDLAGGAVLMTKQEPLPPIHGLAWHPYDPDLLAAGGCGISLWDVRTKELRAKLPGQAGPTVAVAFSHRGDVLASRGWGDTSVRLWDPWTGRQLVKMTPAAIEFSPDDRRLAYAMMGSKIGLLDVEVSREYRTLAGHAKIGEGTYLDMDISPDGRLLAVGSVSGPSNGIHLWDLATGRMLRYLPVGPTYAVRFDRQGRGLLSGHDRGVAFWPMRSADETTREIGPPRWLRVPGPCAHLAVSGDGRRLACAHWNSRGSIVELAAGPAAQAASPTWPDWDGLSALFGGGDKRLPLSHGGLLNVALSADGRWAVTGTHHGENVIVWDAVTGERIKTLPARWSSDAAFSPDGKWLVTAVAEEYRIYETESWQLRHRLPRTVGGDSPGPMAFSHDSQVLAIVVAEHTVQLIHPATARVLANLEPPDGAGDLPGKLRFSPDGSQLAVCTSNLRTVHVWDLRLIGKRLAELGLDWSVPAAPAEPAELKPLRVVADLGMFGGVEDRKQAEDALRARQWQKALEAADRALALSKKDVAAWRLRAEAHLGLHQFDRAMADYKQSLALATPDAGTENLLAWRLALQSGVTADQAAQAIVWAKKAVELAPKVGTYWNTLGLAYYRAGKWDEAIQALRQSQKLSARLDAYDGFVLAMAHWQRGERDQARNAYDAAARWMEQQAPEDEELRGLRDEAVACARTALRLELAHCAAALQKDPKDADAFYRRGRVHYYLRQYAPARDDFSSTLAIKPEHVEAYHYRGHAHQYLKQYPEAVEDFSAALQRKPKSAHFYDMRAVCRYQLKEPENALDDWQRSFDLNPKVAAVCHSLAWLYVTGPESQRDPAKAVSLAEQAVRLAPGGYSYLTGLGVAHYRLGQYDKAVEALNKAAAARPGGPSAVSQLFLAMGYQRLGDERRARALYDQALSWWQAQSGLSELQVEQLNAFRAEAELLIKEP